MDFFAADWKFEMESDSAASFQEWQMNSVNVSVDNLNMNPFSPSSYIPYPASSTEISPNSKASQADVFISEQQPKNNDTYGKVSSAQKIYSSPSTNIISFGNLSEITTQNPYRNLNRTFETEAELMPLGEMSFPPPISPLSIQKLYAALGYEEPVKRSITRSSSQAQDHVLAERKRREKLSELFISLSTMIPGLKKLDKASILERTIHYLKELEDHLRTLEQEQKKRKHEESVVPISAKRTCRLPSSCDHATSSSDENFNSSLDQPLPDNIEVRLCDGNVLISLYCKKRTGIIREILCEIEKLDLCIINSSVIPFGDTTLHISIITKMNAEFWMPEEDFAENIRLAILKLTL